VKRSRAGGCTSIWGLLIIAGFLANVAFLAIAPSALTQQ